MNKRIWLLWAVLMSAVAMHATPVGDILRHLRDPQSGRVLVVAHRADWRNAPENSLAAMRRAVLMGVDIVETDVRRTKDGKFVIMHDRSIDRTTTGKGLVADHTLAELRELRLLAATGHPTNEKIPTLEEALEVVRGKALINLDKSAEHPAEIFAVVEACQATDYALMSVTQSRDEFRKSYPGLLDKMLYMIVAPMRNPGSWDLIGDYLKHEKPAVIQVTFEQSSEAMLLKFAEVPKSGVRLWVNSIWPEQNGGHDDERALDDPDGAYGWLLQQQVSIIQTDRPQLLLEYLRAHGRR